MMQVKRYVAPSFAEALIQAKRELGTDAMIVENKKVKVGGYFGFFAKEMTELTVAVEQPDPKAAAASFAVLEQEIVALRQVVARLAERPAVPAVQGALTGAAGESYQALVAAGVDEAVAFDLAGRVGTAQDEGRQRLRAEIGRLMGQGAPMKPRSGHRTVVALIGPTGVGKTTTLAKLAAHFTLEKGLKVALLTTDTFRIAAVDQLRTYAEILGIPLHTCDTPESVANAMRETAKVDLVLVDTAGRNHKDPQRMQELQDLLAMLRPDETHLCLSLTAGPRDAFEAMDYYLPLGVNRITFTKLDEAATPGLMLNVRMRCQEPVGYVTNGQSVPDDILRGDEVDFATLLWRGQAHA